MGCNRHNLQQPDIGLSRLTAGKTSFRGKKPASGDTLP